LLTDSGIPEKILPIELRPVIPVYAVIGEALFGERLLQAYFEKPALQFKEKSMSASIKLFVIFGVLLSIWAIPQTACAQRYLTEFVGSTRMVSGPATNFDLNSNLEFIEQDNRRVEGFFSYIEQGDPLDPQVLAAQGTLAASGNCNVQLVANSVSGALKLVEQTFDANSFGLFGQVTITQSGNGGVLPAGKSVANLAVLQPVADAEIVSPRNWRVVLRSNQNGVVSEITKELDFVDANQTVHGILGRAGDPAAFDITASASDKWFYMVGTNANGFIKLRGAVEFDEFGTVTGYVGTFELLDSNGRVSDQGTAVGTTN
jgi:hypothetical protein